MGTVRSSVSTWGGPAPQSPNSLLLWVAVSLFKGVFFHSNWTSRRQWITGESIPPLKPVTVVPSPVGKKIPGLWQSWIDRPPSCEHQELPATSIQQSVSPSGAADPAWHPPCRRLHCQLPSALPSNTASSPDPLLSLFITDNSWLHCWKQQDLISCHTQFSVLERFEKFLLLWNTMYDYITLLSMLAETVLLTEMHHYGYDQGKWVFIWAQILIVHWETVYFISFRMFVLYNHIISCWLYFLWFFIHLPLMRLYSISWAIRGLTLSSFQPAHYVTGKDFLTWCKSHTQKSRSEGKYCIPWRKPCPFTQQPHLRRGKKPCWYFASLSWGPLSWFWLLSCLFQGLTKCFFFRDCTKSSVNTLYQVRVCEKFHGNLRCWSIASCLDCADLWG